jgi:hypothetical protein
LLVVVTLAVFFSPQWILWFAPLLLPLVRKDRLLGWSVAALDAVTYMIFPIWFWVMRVDWPGDVLRVGRFVVCLAIGVQLVRMEWARPEWLRALGLALMRGRLMVRRALDRS